jgi:hypothetical protein
MRCEPTLISRGIPVDGGIERAEKTPRRKTHSPHVQDVAVHESKMSDVNGADQQEQPEPLRRGDVQNARPRVVEKGLPTPTVPGSWSSGGEAVKAFLTRNGIDTSKIRDRRWVGLSRENR